MPEQPNEDLEAVGAVARPGDSLTVIAEKLADKRTSSGRSFHKIKVHRVVSAMRRRIGETPADRRTANGRRAGDTVAKWRRRR